MASAEDYPYDPKRCGDPSLQSLDMLRAVWDRAWAKYLWELYPHCQKNERDPKMRARLEREQRDKRDADAANLESMKGKALGGVYGPLARKIADEFMAEHGNSSGALEELRRRLADMPEGSRISG